MLGTFVLLEIIAFILIFLFVPETASCKPSERDSLNHMSLEELNSIFETKTLHHTRWRFQEALPHRVEWMQWRMTPEKYSGPEPTKEIPVYRWKQNDSPAPESSTTLVPSQETRSDGVSPARAATSNNESNRVNARSSVREIGESSRPMYEMSSYRQSAERAMSTAATESGRPSQIHVIPRRPVPQSSHNLLYSGEMISNRSRDGSSSAAPNPSLGFHMYDG